MELTFAEVVDEVRDLPIEGKRELMRLLEKELIEARRDEILKNGEDAKRAYENGELTSYTDVDKLMADLNA
jgi:hypothetical protein